jgi:hypothetical protein
MVHSLEDFCPQTDHAKESKMQLYYIGSLIKKKVRCQRDPGEDVLEE